MDRHAQGIVLITLSAVAYSSAGFFTRLIHLDAWTMLFWRGLFAGLMIGTGIIYVGIIGLMVLLVSRPARPRDGTGGGGLRLRRVLHRVSLSIP